MKLPFRWPFRRERQADGPSASHSPVSSTDVDSGSSRPAEITRAGAIDRQPPQCWVYDVDDKFPELPESPTRGKLNKALAFVPPVFVQSNGLPAEAIYGFFTGDLSAEELRPNRTFVDFMHRTIARAGPTDPMLIVAGERQRDGYVYVIDLRTPDGPQGEVPMEDIVGGFKVLDGVILPDGYWANSDHRVLTGSGLVRLPAALQEAMLAALPSVTN